MGQLALRQRIEVLHDQLLQAFTQDPTLRPRDVIVMVPDVAAYAPYYGSVHRGAGYLSQLSTDLFEASRATVAEFLGCRPDDQVVFTRSTTET